MASNLEETRKVIKEYLLSGVDAESLGFSEQQVKEAAQEIEREQAQKVLEAEKFKHTQEEDIEDQQPGSVEAIQQKQKEAEKLTSLSAMHYGMGLEASLSSTRSISLASAYPPGGLIPVMGGEMSPFGGRGIVSLDKSIQISLETAAAQGNPDKIQSLVATGISINTPGISGTSLLATALMNHRSNTTRAILEYAEYEITEADLEEVEALIQERHYSGQSTLQAFKEMIKPHHLATVKAAGKVSKCIEEFLKASSELIFSKRTGEDYARLLAAAAQRKVDGPLIMATLLREGANINSQYEGNSLLATALANKNSDSIIYLLQHSIYKLTMRDIKAVETLIKESQSSNYEIKYAAEVALRRFTENVTVDKLQGLDIESIKGILPTTTVQRLQKIF